MPLRKPRQNRSGGADQTRLLHSKSLGAVRGSQMINTFGVGAMVAIDDQSYIVSGLDSWRLGRAQQPIHEPRLQRRMGVRAFYAPPAKEDQTSDGVRIRRFPRMYSCPGCGDLKTFEAFGATVKKPVCTRCDRNLVTSRFVVACENGHIDDFPYWAWVHKRHARNSETSEKHDLRLCSEARTASLQSIIVECSCELRASMEGAFGRTAMSSLDLTCKGERPWLGSAARQPGCDAALRTLQRGASAAWFAVTRSSISIPPWSESLQKLVDKHHDWLAAIADEPNAKDIIERRAMLANTSFTAEDLIAAFIRRRVVLDEDTAQEADTFPLEASSAFRLEEFDPLYSGSVDHVQGEEFECTKPDDSDENSLPYGLGRSMLAKRLREVRALESFTRVEAPDAAPDRRRRAAVSKEKIDWLPAVEVSGEGVFVTLDDKVLVKWETWRDAAVDRAETIRKRHTKLLHEKAARRGDESSASQLTSPISARYVLVHTLAHVLINEWSLDSGYPAASLRERLYVSDEHAGLLIYTATSDSAGSLGGLVVQGTHARLAETLESALNRIGWCSQDPPCMETEASGTDSLNLAACYACVMVPESSCETNNTFLDRAMLIGTPEKPRVGFFTDDRDERRWSHR